MQKATTKKATASAKLTVETKEKADFLLEQMGLNMSIYINMAVSALINERELPFTPSGDTREALVKQLSNVIDKQDAPAKEIPLNDDGTYKFGVDPHLDDWVVNG